MCLYNLWELFNDIFVDGFKFGDIAIHYHSLTFIINWDPSFVAKYYHGTSDTDSTHPNTNGHKIFAPRITNFLNKLL